MYQEEFDVEVDTSRTVPRPSPALGIPPPPPCWNPPPPSHLLPGRERRTEAREDNGAKQGGGGKSVGKKRRALAVETPEPRSRLESMLEKRVHLAATEAKILREKAEVGATALVDERTARAASDALSAGVAATTEEKLVILLAEGLRQKSSQEMSNRGTATLPYTSVGQLGSAACIVHLTPLPGSFQSERGTPGVPYMAPWILDQMMSDERGVKRKGDADQSAAGEACTLGSGDHGEGDLQTLGQAVPGGKRDDTPPPPPCWNPPPPSHLLYSRNRGTEEREDSGAEEGGGGRSVGKKRRAIAVEMEEVERRRHHNNAGHVEIAVVFDACTAAYTRWPVNSATGHRPIFRPYDNSI